MNILFAPCKNNAFSIVDHIVINSKVAKGKIALHFIEKQRVLKNALLSRVLVGACVFSAKRFRASFDQLTCSGVAVLQFPRPCEAFD